MCEFHDSNGNGLGDMWWTDTCIYFSIIDVNVTGEHPVKRGQVSAHVRYFMTLLKVTLASSMS